MMLCPLNVGLNSITWFVNLTCSFNFLNTLFIFWILSFAWIRNVAGFFSHIKGCFHKSVYFPKGLWNWTTFNNQRNLSKILTLHLIYFGLNLETKSCHLCRGRANKKMRTDHLNKKLGTCNRLQLTVANHYNRITVINYHCFLHTEKCR